VSLAEMRANRKLGGFDLLRLPRLSVMPVPDALYRRLLALAGE
jgi:predicted RNA-binding protein with PUA-like domain